MGMWKDLLGTTINTFGIGKGKATISASGLTAARTVTLPDKSGTVVMEGLAISSGLTVSIVNRLLGRTGAGVGALGIQEIGLGQNLDFIFSNVSVVASGSTGQIQVNNGNALAAYSGFTYNDTTGVLTVGSITGNAATVTTNANLTGPITSTGNATAVAAQTGTGSTFVMQASPTLTTPNLGTPSAGVMTNVTGTAAGLTAGNSSQLLSATWAAPGAIGSTTCNTGAFSALTTIGNVAIGTTTADMSLTIYGPSFIPGANYDALLNLYSTDALGAGVGGGILFGGTYAGTTKTGWAEISGVKEDAVSGNYGGILKLKTRNNGGAMVTRMTILPNAGNVGIGVTSPVNKLEVDGTIKFKVYTVATLPSASTMGNGARSHVSDSNSSTFAATVASGGSTSVPVYSDGTNWKIG